jgi:very-short-patch-repair endonuclease
LAEKDQCEKLLWRRLKAGPATQSRFKQRQTLGKYVVDFIDWEKKLVIELEGTREPFSEAHARRRYFWLNDQGFRTLRFQSREVFENCEAVVQQIGLYLSL